MLFMLHEVSGSSFKFEYQCTKDFFLSAHFVTFLVSINVSLLIACFREMSAL